MNQCDGCQRGLPIDDGIHVGPNGAWDLIGCTRHRYDSPDMRTPARFAGSDAPSAEAFKASQAKVVQILVGVARGDQMREQDAIAARQVLRAMGLEV